MYKRKSGRIFTEFLLYQDKSSFILTLANCLSFECSDVAVTVALIYMYWIYHGAQKSQMMGWNISPRVAKISTPTQEKDYPR